MVCFIPKKGARLGNWLFQCAVAASVGDGRVATLDVPYARAAKERYSDFLGSLELMKSLPIGAPIVKEDRSRAVEIGHACNSDIVLDGYFQRAEYLNRDKVLSLFAVPSDKLAKYNERFGEWLGCKDITAIHVRRGDYMRLSHCHPFVGEDYFRDCLALIPEIKNFMVFSDDIKWCKKFFPKAFPERKFCFVEGTNMIDDLHLQSLCCNNIISNSSFSWWAAYLNRNLDKKIFAPSNWFGFYLKMLKVDSTGMYYDGMRVVHNGYTPWGYVKGFLDMCREVPLNLAAMLYHCFVKRC